LPFDPARHGGQRARLTGNGLDDPDQTLYENFTCGAEGNYDRYCSPELGKMVDRQSMEFDLQNART
jgi:peptide/nickel transport system substrate-binding protein